MLCCYVLESQVLVHTGHVEDVGLGDGKHYSVNVPLQEGMDDESYRFMFEPIMQKVCPKSNHFCPAYANTNYRFCHHLWQLQSDCT